MTRADQLKDAFRRMIARSAESRRQGNIARSERQFRAALRLNVRWLNARIVEVGNCAAATDKD